MQTTIDLNCDMGESFGAWRMGDDEAVLPFGSSINLACGFHAGDPQVMRRTVALAKAHGVAVGAHPSLPDLQGFGRRTMKIAPDEAYALVLYQIGAADAFARAAGVALAHVKPHGALYNMAARDAALARAIAQAVTDFNAELILVGLSGGALVEAGRERGLRVANEVFADRRYDADGSLAPRGAPDAVIEDPVQAASQVLQMIEHRAVESRDGKRVPLVPDTVCIHGDRPDAAAFARAIRVALESVGVAVRAL
jgi:UPF0271 protein